MSSLYVLSPEARADLEEIIDFIAEDNLSAAERVLQKLRAAMERLAEMPLLGHLRSDLTREPLRFWQVYSYLIIYRPEKRPLEIVRLLHSSRDVQYLLDPPAL